jgi:NADPH:quinone reductase-like Zn-dependent oxidoreductase
MFIHGTYRFNPKFPQIAGMEAIGIIEAVAEGLSLYSLSQLMEALDQVKKGTIGKVLFVPEDGSNKIDPNDLTIYRE